MISSNHACGSCGKSVEQVVEAGLGIPEGVIRKHIEIGVCPACIVETMSPNQAFLLHYVIRDFSSQLVESDLEFLKVSRKYIDALNKLRAVQDAILGE